MKHELLTMVEKRLAFQTVQETLLDARNRLGFGRTTFICLTGDRQNPVLESIQDAAEKLLCIELEYAGQYWNSWASTRTDSPIAKKSVSDMDHFFLREEGNIQKSFEAYRNYLQAPFVTHSGQRDMACSDRQSPYTPFKLKLMLSQELSSSNNPKQEIWLEAGFAGVCFFDPQKGVDSIDTIIKEVRQFADDATLHVSADLNLRSPLLSAFVARVPEFPYLVGHMISVEIFCDSTLIYKADLPRSDGLNCERYLLSA